MHFRTDSTWLRAGTDGRTVLAGSPLRIFRLTPAGAALVDRIERGEPVQSPLVDRLLDAGAIHPLPAAPESFSRSDVTVVTPQLGGVVMEDGRVTVDDASDPPLRGATVRLDHNLGPAGARNAGSRLVSTPIVAFVDADVDLPTTPGDPNDGEWWAPLLAHFDDPAVGLVAPRIAGDVGSSLDLGAEPARIRAGTRVGYVPAAMMLVRTAALDDVGGFDETMRFGEDVDLVWRFDEAGWRCRYEPARSVDHRPRASLLGRLRQQVGYGSSSASLSLRHPGAVTPYRSNVWTAGGWLLVTLGHPVVAASVGIVSAARFSSKLPELAHWASMRLALRGHLAAGQQFLVALRRAWWPILVFVALVSTRARRALAAAVLADPGRIHIDVAFGWGLWRSMLRHRDWGPITPKITRLQ